MHTGEAIHFDSLLASVLENAMAKIRSEVGAAMRFDGEDVIRMVHARGLEPHGVGDHRAGYSRTILREVRDSAMGRVVTDAGVDPRYSDAESVRFGGLRSVLVAPVEVDGKVVGAIWLSNPLRSGAFKFGDLDRLTAICQQADGAARRLP
ncbi:MAG: GAF domain-containing protein [Armatimonadetes bacterium]|nr:GAF domain-containing protein [Armatimonadota bacterium]